MQERLPEGDDALDIRELPSRYRLSLPSRYRLSLPSRYRLAWALAALLALVAALALSPADSLAQQAPGTPSSVSVTRADGTLTATWPAVSGATKYHVTYSSDNGKSWRLGALNHTSTSISIAVSNDKTYIVGVRGGNSYGWGGWRNSPPSGPFAPPTPPTPPPATPSSVSVTRSDGELTASWPAVSGALHYHVTYSSDGGASWSLAALKHLGTSIDVRISNDETYIVGVRALGVGGWGGWRNSAPAGPYTPMPKLPGPGPNPPPAPTGLTATAGDQSVTLTWDSAPDVSITPITGYQYISRAAPPAPGWGAWTAVPGSDRTTTSYTITGLTNGTEYRFKLRAVNAGGGGAPAPTASPWYVAATPAAGTVNIDTPGQPTGLTATANDDGSATITWTDPNDASITGYQYQTREDDGVWGGNTEIEGSGASTTSHTITGLVGGATNHINLQALNASGASLGRQVSVLVPASLPGPASVTITARGMGTLSATWTAVDGAFTYYIQTSNSNDDYATFTIETLTTGTSVTLNNRDDSLNYTVLVHAFTENGYTKRTESYPAGMSNSPAIAPESVSLSRSGTTLTATWPAVGGAASYNVELSSDGGDTWSKEATNHTTTTWTKSSIGASTSYKVRVQSKNTAGTSAWTESEVNTPAPPAPASVTVTSRSHTGTNATLEISWDAAARATGYNIRSSGDNGATWTTDVSSHPLTTLSLTLTDNTKDYFIGVQAVNSNGASGWTNSSISRATPLPPAPANLTPTRAKGSITLTWDAASGAASYDVACSVSGGHYWDDCKKGVTDAQRTAGVTLTQFYNHGAGQTQNIDDGRNYTFAVRGRNTSGAGEWTRATAWTARPDRIASVTATRTVSGITLTMTAPANNGGYTTTQIKVDCRTSSDGGTTWSGWFSCTDAQTTTPTPGAAFTATIDSTDNYDTTLTYQARARARNALGVTWDWRESAVIPPITLTAGSVTATGATLTIAGHTGSWYVKEISPATNGSCSSAISGATKSLSSLTAGTWYSYRAYSDSTCTDANEIGAVAFSTAVTVSNLGGSNSSNTLAIQSNQAKAQEFTTGSAAGGYTVSSVKVHTFLVFNASLFKVTIRERNSNGHPGTSLATLPGTPANYQQTTYTCSGSGCALDPNTQYFIFVESTGGNAGILYATSDDAETLQPTGNGWSIANDVRAQDRGWGHWSNGVSLKISVTAVPQPGIAASSVTATTATLTLNGHVGDWWFKRTTPSGGTCTAGEADYSHALSSLTPGTDYTYKAYSDSGCTTSKEIGSGTFTTPASLTASGVTAAGATLTIAGHTGDWYLKQTAPSTGTCSANAITGATHTLSTLTHSTTYTYKAYSDSACTTANLLATETFTTPASLTASSVTMNSATLTLAGRTGNWWLKQTAPTTGTCAAGEADFSHALSSLSTGTTYTYKAYSDSTCSTEIASGTFTTALSPPTGLSGTRTYSGTANSDSVSLSWTAPASSTGRTGYEAGCSADAGSTWTSCGGTIASSATSHTVSSLDKDNAYVIRLRATGSGGATSAWAQSSSMAALSAPGKPTNLSVDTSVWQVSWTAPSDTGNGGGGITKYEHHCKRGATGTPTPADETTNTYANVGTNTTCTQSFGQGTYFRVRAFNLIWGAWSDWYQIQ